MVVSVSIKAILRTDKQIKLNGKYPIYYLVRLDDKQIKIPAKKEAEKIYWDKVSGRLQKNAPDASILNDALAKCEQDFKDFILKNEMNGKAVAADEIKRHFNGSRSISFYDFYLEVVKVKKLKPN